jgi:predicted N-acetyltransferase YhbS
VICSLEPPDWPAVRATCEEGIAPGVATFEAEAPSSEAWDDTHLPAPRLVLEAGNEVVGWAALSPVSDRAAYASVVEDSVSVSEQARGKGVGRALLLERRSAAVGRGEHVRRIRYVDPNPGTHGPTPHPGGGKSVAARNAPARADFVSILTGGAAA